VADVGGASPAPTGIESQPADNTPSPGEGSGAGSPPASPADSPNIRQLREQYETLKKEYEPYKTLGSVEDLQAHSAIATKAMQPVLDLGTTLGYSEDEVRAALSEDPYGTYEFLKGKQKELEQTGQVPDLEKLLERKLEQRLKPFEQERRQQQIEKARGVFDQTFEVQVKEAFKDEELTEDELSYIYASAFHSFDRDKDAAQMLMQGKTSGAVKHMQEAIQSFNKAYLARYARDHKRAGGNPSAGATQQGKPKLSLDDIIQGEFPSEMKLG